MLHVPEHIKTIKPYVPGKPIEELERELGIEGSIKLASNESPLGPSSLALRVLREGLSGLNRYPDGSCYFLRNALSKTLGTAPDEILFGNGSNEIIELAVRTFMKPGDEAIMAHPSFVVYSMIVQAAGGKNVIVPLKDLRHDLDAMASEITERTKIIFIANPNNPTGTMNTKAEMEAFMEKVPEGVLVAVDEAYYEYVSSPDYADSLKYFRQGKDILILRTFSKIYGLAGLRIGYGIANILIITEMDKVRQPFNVNAMAQSAARAALKDRAHVEKAKKINERGKKYLYKELRAMKIRYVPTEANFIYIILEDDSASGLYEGMLKQGVIVRPMGKREIRVTIGLPKENKRFIAVLKELLSD
ncbi:MAG TPA: histidinol-phosphate transaminase [Nitrospirae bacterium]|nr:histidinol-phosphate aminotransferase 2 [bacterium BMS3Abin10]GBE37619.1 histidinol-phosphate aminotransferase 2 [bacterium BMS3Bbin08]HDH50422.1 histidinol-phosphate transaminase [Nitrospirota bacterium]HDK17572.1 histidinol-phosphate transaminase [Nitrospirota bacterium]HDK81225.1 histidinol-phosphate transaminase [Nitrospirota bacterium]